MRHQTNSWSSSDTELPRAVRIMTILVPRIRASPSRGDDHIPLFTIMAVMFIIIVTITTTATPERRSPSHTTPIKRAGQGFDHDLVECPGHRNLELPVTMECGVFCLQFFLNSEQGTDRLRWESRTRQLGEVNHSANSNEL